MSKHRQTLRSFVFVGAVGLAAAWPNHGFADAPVGRYSITDTTVYDTKTLLTWQRVVPIPTYTWIGAEWYCANLSLNGLTGWRLPTIKEFHTIVDDWYEDPSIDRNAFPNTRVAYYWTSILSPYDPAVHYTVGFSRGQLYPGNTTDYMSVRCVR